MDNLIIVVVQRSLIVRLISNEKINRLQQLFVIQKIQTIRNS